MTGWMIGGGAFALALLCAAQMGVSIQRGGTCTVAAIDELLTQHRATRLLALVEASLWVAAGLLLARQAGWLSMLPAGYPLTGWTLLGAAVLALGAVVNGACAFGTIARLGGGDWAFLATPAGYYLGCLTASAVWSAPAAQPLDHAPPLFQLPAWVLWIAGGLALWRLATTWRRGGWSLQRAWSPHAATTATGLLFATLLVLAGAWAYTDVLADLARRMAVPLAGDQGLRLALALALLAGAVAGGRLGKGWSPTPASLPALARCLAGGLLMGWGANWVPGGNDGLVLIAMPLLWPYGWAAFAGMGATVALALAATRGRLPQRLRWSLRLLATCWTMVHGYWIIRRRFHRLDRTQQHRQVQQWAQRLLASLGVTLQVRGQFAARGAMLVSNHVSWLDIVVLHAICPQARFVAKSDVRGWPLIGTMAAAAGTLFVERRRTRQAVGIVGDILDALQAGDTVVVFPEGTTSDGQGVLKFHGNLLQAAVQAGCDLHPVALRYAEAGHAISPRAPYIGDTSLGQSLWWTCQADTLVARLDILAPRRAPHADRRSLARAAQADIAQRLDGGAAP